MADDLDLQAKQSNQKTVLVSVYTEGPRWRNMAPSGNRHHVVRNNNKKEHLRASSADQHEDRSYFLKPKPDSPKQSATNTVASRKKAKGSKSPPGCVEKCEVSMSNFCRSVKNVEVGNMTKRKKHTGSKNNTMKSAMKSLQMRKKKGFVAKMLQKLQKYR